MASDWITIKKPSVEFDGFISLYTAFLEGKTSDPLRLRYKIEKLWDSLEKVKKKDFTDRLVATGLLEDILVKLIKTFNGTIQNPA